MEDEKRVFVDRINTWTRLAFGGAELVDRSLRIRYNVF